VSASSCRAERAAPRNIGARGFNQTIMDAPDARYHRMLRRQHNAVGAGHDHAGIATQIVVERQIEQKQGKSRHDPGRKNFRRRRLEQWKEPSGSTITHQNARMGAAYD